MKNYIILTGLMLMLFVGSGCASIISKSEYPVMLNSSPSGAKVTIKNEIGNIVFTGKTPTSAVLKSGTAYFDKGKYTIIFEKEGHESNTQKLIAEFDSAYLGNILFGGLIGMLIVDPTTGAMWKLPHDVSASLREKFPPEEFVGPLRPPHNAAAIIEKLQLLKELKQKKEISDKEFNDLRKKLLENFK